MKTSKEFIITLIAIVIAVVSTQAQNTQKGLDIDGEMGGDRSGQSVSMPDSNTVAIGAPYNGNGTAIGHVRIYSWNSSSWVQKGVDIDGEAALDKSGWAVSMPDNNTIAIAAPYNDGNGFNAGHVRIYSWSGSAWVQKGTDIDGEAAGDSSAYSVSMADSNTIAIGSPYNDGNGFNAGQVRIYSWNGNAWVQKGADIDGEAVGDESGWSISMPDNNTIAIGARSNGGNTGHVRIYSWSGSAWVQKGSDIDGEGIGNFSGWSVSMPVNNIVAIGAPGNIGNGSYGGHVRIYSWNGSTWEQKGADIEGEAYMDYSGCSVSMPNSNTVAIGALFNNGNESDAGHVRIYGWNGSVWVQKGADIDGEAADDNSGYSVSMPDSNTVAIGAPSNEAGHVEVYSLITVSIKENNFESNVIVYPNPTSGQLLIDLGMVYNDVLVIIRNALGQEVSKEVFDKVADKLQVNIPSEEGIYFVDLNAGNRRALLKVIKK